MAMTVNDGPRFERPPGEWGERELSALERLLPGYVAGQRWYRSKAGRIERLVVRDCVPFTSRAALLVIDVDSQGAGGDRAATTERYSLPVSVLPAPLARGLGRSLEHHVIQELPGGAVLCDGLADTEALAALLAGFDGGVTLRGDGSELAFVGGPLAVADHTPHPLAAEQSNSTIRYGRAYVLKLLRRLEAGESADVELGRFLTARDFPAAPRVEGELHWTPRGGESVTLGVLHAFVPNDGEAWGGTRRRLARLLAENPLPPVPRGSLLPRRANDPDAVPQALLGDLDRAAQLGRRTAELHEVLASDPLDPAFAPEAFTLAEQARLADAALLAFDRHLVVLDHSHRGLPAAAAILSHADEIRTRLREFTKHEVGGQRTRVHGDLHLGQLLEHGSDITFIDFEGEPARSPAERRSKRSPLVDVAGLLRSFHYAEVTAGRAAREIPAALAWLSLWHHGVTAALMRGYLGRIEGSAILPATREGLERALDFFLLEKCIYELGYELDNRPDWVAVPLLGLCAILAVSPLRRARA